MRVSLQDAFDLLLARVEELERENRELRHDVARLQDAGGPAWRRILDRRVVLLGGYQPRGGSRPVNPPRRP